MLWVLVERTHIPSVLAAALTLIAAFIVRFLFHALVVYAPRKQRGAKVEESQTPLADELAL